MTLNIEKDREHTLKYTHKHTHDRYNVQSKSTQIETHTKLVLLEHNNNNNNKLHVRFFWVEVANCRKTNNKKKREEKERLEQKKPLSVDKKRSKLHTTAATTANALNSETVWFSVFFSPLFLADNR